MRWRWSLAFPVVLAAACTGPTSDPSPRRPVAAQEGQLDAFALMERPAEVLSVTEVTARGKPGDVFAVAGQIAPASVGPFSATRAAFLLMDPRDLQVDEIRDELACPDAET